MKILFWGPVTLQWFHFDVKNAKPANKKNFLSRARALAQPQKSASAHKRGKKKIFSNPLMMGIKKAEFYVDFKNINLY
jgi:hypothetical protein